MLVALERLARSISRDRYAPMAAKEMTIASIKGNRGQADLRSAPPARWDSHLPQ